MPAGNVEKALNVLRFLPRISLGNIRPNPHTNMKKKRYHRGQHGGYRHGYPHKGPIQHMSHPRVGYAGDEVPYYIKVPCEGSYYKDHFLRRQYPPLTLGKLQLMIDTGRLAADEVIDLTVLCNTQLYHINPYDNHFGVHLTDEGMDKFKARVNIEVQHAKEHVIAAVERNGGILTTAYYDMASVLALHNPLLFFKRGTPIPKRGTPPPDIVEYYADPKNRGYLADPELIAQERLILSQKYGYKLPEISPDIKFPMKDPRQVFFGLEPGWLVNLKDKIILRPKGDWLQEYYSDEQQSAATEH